MDPKRWARVQELFIATADLPAEARGEMLAAEDPEVRVAVLRLLAADTDPATVLEGSAEQLLSLELTLEQGPAETRATGERIGRYRLLESIGDGGMGVVYLAEHEEFEQRVALKVIKRGMDTDEIVRRFEAERRILARLEHPGIARLLDGGVTEDGLPWFSMEYVDGLPIDTYCAEHALDLDARLALFTDVAEAVQYAHANLVVHRDLKPGNVLVTADGTVKLLDFGIAKVLDTEDADSGAGMTRTGIRPMTPAYAAPEQILGQPVTTATDVYALGMVLYELITGERPFDTDPNSLGAEYAARERTPPRPSTRSGTMPRARGDLDTIVLMALRYEPDRRYASAEAFADDVRRFRTGHPVRAARDSGLYRMRRYVSRNRGAVSGAAVMVLALVGVVATYTVQLRAERDRARLEAETATAVSDFLEEMFTASDPAESLGEETTARELLDRGGERIAENLADQPAVQARMFGVVGRVYGNLGLYEDAAIYAERAMAAREMLEDVSAEDRIEALKNLSVSYRLTTRLAEADSFGLEALDLARATYGAETEEVAAALYGLAEARFEGREYASVDTLLDQALEIRRSVHEGDHSSTAETLGMIGQLNYAGAYYPEAEEAFREAKEMWLRLDGGRTPAYARSLSNWGLSLLNLRAEEAEQVLGEALALRTELLGPDHPDVGQTMYLLGVSYQFQGKLEDAERVLEDALAQLDESVGAGHPQYNAVTGNLARTYRLLGRLDKSEQMLRTSLARYDEIYGRETDRQVNALNLLANTLADMGRLEEAEEVGLEHIAMKLRATGPEASTYVAYQNLASYRRDAGDAEGAVAYYRDALDAVRATPWHPPTEHTRALFPLAQYLQGLGRHEEAEGYFREALDIRLEHLPAGDWAIASARSLLGDALIPLERYDEAEDLLLTAWNEFEAVNDPEVAATVAARQPEVAQRLVRLYEASSDAEQAGVWRARLDEPGGD